MRRPALVLANLVFLVLATACNDSSVQPSLQSPAIPSTPADPMATVSRLDLGTLGGTRSYATDINDAGIVVGWSLNAAGVDRAFRWTLALGMTDLGTLPGDDWSRAISVTNTGQVFGVSGRLPDNIYIGGSPVVWTPSGDATALPIPLLSGAVGKQLGNRNERGQVIGTDQGGAFQYPNHAWVWSESVGIQDINPPIPLSIGISHGHDINASGLAMGTIRLSNTCTDIEFHHDGECWRTFLWNSLTGESRDIGIPSGDNVRRTHVTGTALNDLGMVVGSVRYHTGYSEEPFLWTDRTGFTVLPTFGGEEGGYVEGYAYDVNLVGTVVGMSSGKPAAWPKLGGIVSLNADDNGFAWAVNLFGVVVGWTYGDTETHATLWKVGPGRGANPQPLTTLSSSAGISTARTALDAPSGPVACLSDRNALMSKQTLIDCVVRTRQ